MKSKKVVVAADGTLSGADAEMMDIVTTAVSTSEAVTGSYGLIQKALFFGAGMAVQNKRIAGNWNPF